LIIGARAFVLGPSHDTSAPRAVATAYVRVIDGDTLRAAGGRIRLSGIDAPELSQTCRDAQAHEWSCGQAAKARLVELVSRGDVACAARGHDRYGRTLAVCSAGDVADLGAALVRDGYAVDYRRYSSDYLAAEDEARAARRGIWQGDFERPENWRRRHPRRG
jgi:endonuclease YncB( thermonuclease family)